MKETPRTLNSVTVVGVHGTAPFKDYWHMGIIHPLGVSSGVVSLRPVGWAIQSIEDFVSGRAHEVFRMYTDRSHERLLKAIELLRFDRGYDWLTNNCEHGLMRLLGLPVRSPQVSHGSGAAAGGGLGLGLVAALLGAKGATLAAAATAGVALGVQGRVRSIRELYASFGLCVRVAPA